MSKTIHIIAFDVPYPPTYGGVIDIFYRVKCLYEAGVAVTLHCFEYGRGVQTELEKYCRQVYYYKRKKGLRYFFNRLPYIVITRSTDVLIHHLLADTSPVLFEGLHSCFYLNDKRLKNRKKIVRMHNIEHKYYSSLARIEKNIFKRIYFQSESHKLKKYETILNQADAIAAISHADEKALAEHYNNVITVSAFHPHDKVNIQPGKGNYILYHGNLKVSENNQAALYLVDEVLNDIDIPFIIAGNGASDELKIALASKPHIQLKENISSDEIYTLIHNAHINILPTFQATGIKLKLLAALYTGRFCIANSPMVKNTGLEQLCIIADTSREMKNEVKRLMPIEFTGEEIAARENILHGNFLNKTNIKKILELI